MTADDARFMAEQWTTREPNAQAKVLEVALQSAENMAKIVKAIDVIYGHKAGPQYVRAFLGRVFAITGV